MSTLNELLTEQSNSSSSTVDCLETIEILRVINSADHEIAAAVEREIPNIARALDGIVERISNGGRLFYLGAGTSGRLGVLDASECPPTFHTPPGLVQGVIAGGDKALRESIERAEDDPAQGRQDLVERGFCARDALVGIAASGRTPYVLGALEFGRSIQALTVGLSCTPCSEVASSCDIAITPTPGPEIITGSTRMRAGTATKLVLNMLSTGVMIRLGYVFGNLMVNVQPTNGKLKDRACRIITKITGVPYDQATRLLEEAGSVRTAILMQKCHLNREQAESRLSRSEGRLRRALEE